MLKRVMVAACVAVFAAAGLAGALAAAEAAKKAPEKMVFTAKPGNVTFTLAEHAKRAEGKCAVCHEKLFKQSAKEPLGYKAGMHKPAEKAKASCAACHVAGGKAFPALNNCKKCHVK